MFHKRSIVIALLVTALGLGLGVGVERIAETHSEAPRMAVAP